MRYVIAAVLAIAFAVLAVLYVSTPIASAIVQRQLFSSPDTAAAMHLLIFTASTLAGLLAGWMVGWRLSARLRRD
ncbi:MAG: hypothetical protein ACM31O_09465 [Bacteroidota bacterium]